jgi:hypothetical protein
MFTGELSLVSDVFKREETNSRHLIRSKPCFLRHLEIPQPELRESLTALGSTGRSREDL